MTLQKIVKGFKKNHECKTCDENKYQIILGKISDLTYSLIRSDPCALNICSRVTKLIRQHPDFNEKDFCITHFDKFLLYATNKCILSSLKTTRILLSKKAKNQNKTPMYHYKLRIMHD